MTWDMEKQRLQYLHKEEAFKRAIKEITLLQQMMGLTIAGEAIQSEYVLRAKECGLTITALSLIAAPATLRLVQNYAFKSIEFLADAMLENQTMFDLKLKMNSEKISSLQRNLNAEFVDRMLRNLNLLGAKMAELSVAGAPVLLKLRQDLECETDSTEFLEVMTEHSENGRRLLNDMSVKIQNHLKIRKDDKPSIDSVVKSFW